MVKKSSADTVPEYTGGRKGLERKAGIVLWGRGEDGELKILAPYCVGRFSEDGKTYTLGKGTVDRGEPVWAGAKREFYEETGIDIGALLEPQETSPYKGVKVHTKSQFGDKRTDLGGEDVPKWVEEHIVRSGRDQAKAQSLYVIEVNGIDNLAKHKSLKTAPNALTPRQQARSLGEHGLPNFTDLLAEMRVMSQTGNRRVGKDLRKRMDRALAKDMTATGIGFSAIEDWYFQARAQNFGEPLPPIEERHITTEKQFDAFFQSVPERIRNRVKDWAQMVKKKVGKDPRYKEYVGDTAASAVKMDAKGRPLRYYSEGAEVLPFTDYLTHIERDITRSLDANDPMIRDYADSMGGSQIVTKGINGEENAVCAEVNSQLGVLEAIYAQCAKLHGIEPKVEVSAKLSHVPLLTGELPLTAGHSR